jgi:hypothetical protein
MSKIPYDISTHEYVCTTLGYMRKASETKDFSQLDALIERVQFHVNNMENAIGEAWETKNKVAGICVNEKLSDEDFKKEVLEAMAYYIDKHIKERQLRAW